MIFEARTPDHEHLLGSRRSYAHSELTKTSSPHRELVVNGGIPGSRKEALPRLLLLALLEPFEEGFHRGPRLLAEEMDERIFRG